MAHRWTSLGRDLFLYRDSCNAYLLRYGTTGIAADCTLAEACVAIVDLP